VDAKLLTEKGHWKLQIWKDATDSNVNAKHQKTEWRDITGEL
jgi:hypothetical protein